MRLVYLSLAVCIQAGKQQGRFNLRTRNGQGVVDTAKWTFARDAQRRQPGARPEPVAHVPAEDDQLAVGQVEGARHPQHHGEAERHQRVEASDEGARHEGLGERGKGQVVSPQ